MKTHLFHPHNELSSKQWVKDFSLGFKHGLPIFLGYIPVAFTFGLIAVRGGLPVGVALLISLTNLTSAGQFAGTNLLISGATLFEITITTLVINIRYLLMSLSLSQKMAPSIPLTQRCLMAFGITDETFSVASLEKQEITFAYMLGLITGPYWGWGLGTALGGLICSVLPSSLQDSVGITLYAMFIALLIPQVKRTQAAFIVAFVAISVSSGFTWLPYLNRISEGWSIIMATVIACLIGAAFFPREDV
ncbi:MAG TPA: branched-chain amino acid ABC transporter permease [Firmicutes bacterium]|nr:branched-chain amino acid ABC transporter permease [Bacillota bacterium]